MKTVKSMDDLKRIALRQGATVEAGREKFNTGGVKAKPTARAPEPIAQPPAPPPPPPAPIVHVDTAAIAQAQERMAGVLAKAIAASMAAQPAPAQPVREWIFTPKRDKDGLITEIRAVAK